MIGTSLRLTYIWNFLDFWEKNMKKTQKQKKNFS